MNYNEINKKLGIDIIDDFVLKSKTLFLINGDNIVNNKINLLKGDFLALGIKNEVNYISDIFVSINKKSEALEFCGYQSFIKEIISKLEGLKNELHIEIPINSLDKHWISLDFKKFGNATLGIASIIPNYFELERSYCFSYKDELTNLFNKLTLSNHLSNISLTNRHYFGYIDLNKFKVVNDTLGHKYGDYVLKTFGEELINNSTENIIFYRLGGDEFFFQTIDIEIPEILKIIEKINDNVKKRLNNELYVGFSLGIIKFIEEIENEPHLVISLADIAMYKSKKNKLPYYIMSKEEIIEELNN